MSRALSRALFSAGSSIAARIAIIAITMSSSIKVKKRFMVLSFIYDYGSNSSSNRVIEWGGNVQSKPSGRTGTARRAGVK